MKKEIALKNLVGRLLILVLALALLGSLLVGCGEDTAASGVNVSDISYEEGVNALSKESMKSVADFILTSAEAREAFVAAYRGYDMTVEDFDLEAERPALEPDAAAAIRVIKKFDTKSRLEKVDYSVLNAADLASIVNVMKTEVDTKTNRGVLETIEYWIGVALGAITNTVGFGNYVIGICVFAIIIELLMLPFSIKQQKNSIRQATLRPKEMAIRKKYAGRDDKATQQKIQQEIQDLYTRENYSPFSGCLPLLLQFPIVIILYNIVIDPVRYIFGFSSAASSALTSFYSAAKAAGGLGQVLTSKRGTIEILSAVKSNGIGAFEGLRDFLYVSNGQECLDVLADVEGNLPSFNMFGLNAGLTPNFQNWLWIVPVLTFFVYFGSMKLTRKFTYQPAASDPQTGCSNNIMDISMPAMSVYVAFITPAAVGVYWIFRSILSTIKQFIMTRVMPLPKFTEEDYKQAEKELKAQSKGKPAREYTSNGEAPRSRHHIDDDDEPYATFTKPTRYDRDESAAPNDGAPAKAKEEKGNANAPASLEQAPMKDDSDKPKNK